MKGNGCCRDNCVDFNVFKWSCDSTDSMVDMRSVKFPDPIPICKYNTDLAISTVEWRARRKDFLEQEKRAKQGTPEPSVADWITSLKSIKVYTA